MPEDALEVTDEEYGRMFSGQESGLVITSNALGYPTLVNPPPPTPEQLASAGRAWRSGQLASTDALVARHRDEKELDEGTTLTTLQYKELQRWRATLRDWANSVDFPEVKPSSPAWLSQG